MLDPVPCWKLLVGKSMAEGETVDQGCRGQKFHEVDAAMVLALTRCAGLALDDERAAALAPYVAAALSADSALADLDMDTATTTGPPWGGAPTHG